MSIRDVIQFIDDYLIKTGQSSIGPVKANVELEKAGLLEDSLVNPGIPLRKLLRKGLIPHAYQNGGKGSRWIIPHSSQGKSEKTNYTNVHSGASTHIKKPDTLDVTPDIVELTNKVNNARKKYKPILIKYLLIAEAPPNSIERFFYYENVKQHDYLFLGIVQALYPKLKEQFLASKRDKNLKGIILRKLQDNGFYLIDLSNLPLSYLHGSLAERVPNFMDEVKKLVLNDTKIILIKANVFDLLYNPLTELFRNNVVNCRIPFPGQGNQTKFQNKFAEALRLIKN